MVLAGVLLLALFVRMREPFVSPVIGAEDPYTHMGHAWDLLHGRGLPADYPPGFAVLLAPFALLGPTLFYAAARFLPPFLGVVEVLGVYLLAKENLRTPAAFVAAIAVALMPENVLRTNLLFPTALDLALLPFYLMLLLRGAQRDRRSLLWAALLAVGLALAHPWVLVYMLPPTIVVALRAFDGPNARRDRLLTLGIIGALAVAGAVFAFLPGTWNPTPSFLKHAGPRALELLRDPRSLFPLPLYVDTFPGMVTWSVLAFAAIGAVTALVRRTTLGLAVLVYSLAIVPFVFVDWFDVWFIPHRSVAYLSLGLALLAALPIELMGAIPEWNLGDVAAAAVVGIYMVAVLTPGALAVTPWYRLYGEDDYDAWHAVAARDPSLVVTGSWEEATGYRAITGKDAIFNPEFLKDPGARAFDLKAHPDSIVLLDWRAREAGFKAPSGWHSVGQWGNLTAYAP